MENPTTQRKMFKSSRTVSKVRLLFQRSVSYNLPSIRLLDSLKSTESDLPGLFSNKTINELWYNRGQALVDNLNAQIIKNNVENAPANLEELIKVSFSKNDLNALFTNASLLHNLQFFLESLKTNEDRSFSKAQISALLKTPSTSIKVENAPQDESLAEWINDSFGSMVEFKTLLLNSAASIKGDGTTWLVAQATYSESAMRDGASTGVSFDTLAIVNTYNAGIVDDSMRSGQVTKMKHQKQLKLDAANRRDQERKEMAAGEVQEQGQAVEEVVQETQKRSISADENALGSVEEAEEVMLFSDRKLVPLLAIDASMRAYLEDYGIYGKRQYLENVWHCVDWDVVASRTPKRFKPSMVFEY